MKICKKCGKEIKENAATAAPEPLEAKSEPLPRIGQAAWDDLVKMALKNGWTEIDIGANVRSLGYKASKKYTALNALDYETVFEFFAKDKKDYEAVQAEAKR